MKAARELEKVKKSVQSIFRELACVARCRRQAAETRVDLLCGDLANLSDTLAQQEFGEQRGASDSRRTAPSAESHGRYAAVQDLNSQFQRVATHRV